MTYVAGSHHVTLSVGHAQEDVDFHTRALGLRFIKKTVLYDGGTPVYHLYYSNAGGDPSAVITTFPWAQVGLYGTRGTNQAREVLLSVPTGSLEFWSRRLTEHGIENGFEDVFGGRRLNLRHPSGIEYVLIEVDDDPREGYTRNGVGIEHAIHGIYGVGIHVFDQDRMVDFGKEAFFASSEVEEEGDRARFRVGDADVGNFVELTGNRTDAQGTWRYGSGAYHHFAWNLGDLQNQKEVRFDIEGAGYTDISELKNRTYFKSHYVRTPGGALFELAVTHDEGGWDCDESPEELGRAFMLPPFFEHEREAIMARLEPLRDED
ncbi:ring-cleaving dioxygenase [Clavibacter michiganensis]|uniref:Chlorohydroquinone/hydroquinone 1,2-dioxygenase n=1 Tax=Clavibacter michiganensis TaxID=28447 RepID=A0A251XUE1_9MICO|nr:VOC family protein [Clavibacter michiganensis]OUE09146.1 Chlorohydroquinone/hydroquinone 1,2-dioxygenase [Clavibacter michiganensis]PPF71037.1 ring-cleaving dioxygenase [Clavibacter michiganensis]